MQLAIIVTMPVCSYMSSPVIIYLGPKRPSCLHATLPASRSSLSFFTEASSALIRASPTKGRTATILSKQKPPYLDSILRLFSSPFISFLHCTGGYWVKSHFLWIKPPAAGENDALATIHLHNHWCLRKSSLASSRREEEVEVDQSLHF